MTGQRIPMARIARELSAFAGRPVQNQTGLSGVFDFQLTWTPDEYVSEDGRAKTLNGIPLDSSAPSFFRAIPEQFGLRLESKNGQIELLIVDAAEQRLEN